MALDRSMATRRLFFPAILFGLALFPLQAADWPNIPPDEMNLKDSPTHPGSHAIILYHEVQTDDITSAVLHHTRIKILTEQGKQYANIELPFLRHWFAIRDVRARTVRPDGSSAEFKGEIYERTIVRGRFRGQSVKFLAKTFSLPDVQVGSIIEFRYREQWDPNSFPGRRWVVQQELPIRRAVFSRKRYREFDVRWISFRIPPEKLPQEGRDGVIRMELENIPPFQEEAFMPPEEELKMRVDFYYAFRMKPPEKFWED